MGLKKNRFVLKVKSHFLAGETSFHWVNGFFLLTSPRDRLESTGVSGLMTCNLTLQKINDLEVQDLLLDMNMNFFLPFFFWSGCQYSFFKKCNM